MKQLILLVVFLICPVSAFADDSLSVVNQQKSGPFIIQSTGGGDKNSFLIFDTQKKDVWFYTIFASGAEKWTHKNLDKE